MDIWPTRYALYVIDQTVTDSGAAQVVLMEPTGAAVVTMTQLSERLQQQYDIYGMLSLLCEYRVRGLIISYYIHHRAISVLRRGNWTPNWPTASTTRREGRRRVAWLQFQRTGVRRRLHRTTPHCRIIVRTRHNHNYRLPKQQESRIESRSEVHGSASPFPSPSQLNFNISATVWPIVSRLHS